MPEWYHCYNVYHILIFTYHILSMTHYIVCIFYLNAVFMPCPPPPQIRNAHLTVSNGRSSYAVYSCYLGHQFHTLGVARSIVCVNGTWINSDLDGCQREMI